MTVVCGIDPGNHGALAFINVDTNSMIVADMPIFEWTTTRSRKKVDAYTVTRMFKQYNPVHIYLEEVWSSPQQGVVSAFSFGMGRGILEGVAAATSLPMTQVKPAQWKKELRVAADKRAAVQRAAQLLPSASEAFYGPRGGVLDGRAEAALLALYGCLELGHAPTKPIQLVEEF